MILACSIEATASIGKLIFESSPRVTETKIDCFLFSRINTIYGQLRKRLQLAHFGNGLWLLAVFAVIIQTNRANPWGVAKRFANKTQQC